MSNIRKLATQCAHIFLAYAIKNGELNKISSGMTFLKNQFKNHPTLEQVLHNPIIPHTGKRQLLATLCKDIDPMLWKFIEIIISQYQIGNLKEIITAFELAYHKHIGLISAVLTTAVFLPESFTKRFIEKVKYFVSCKEVLLKQKIDPSIIGGYILQIGTLKLDRSVKNSLKLLKNRFR